MKFSICVPNYNYAGYVGTTIASALGQGIDVEVIVADNASTDASVDAVRAIDDPRVRIIENPWNVGFAANLDVATTAATGDWQILLSSDDLINEGALRTYAAVIEHLGCQAQAIILSSAQHIIDQHGNVTGHLRLDKRLWRGAVKDEELSRVAGHDVWVADADMLLGNSLRAMRTPFGFATTCYARTLYDSVGGYRSIRLINPDKPFAWKLMAQAQRALFIDAPLFAYRVHANNQNSLQARSGALKHLVDQYVATFDTPPAVVQRAGMTNADLAKAFVEEDILLRGFKKVADGDRIGARRGLAFGKAVYPALAWSGKHVLLHLLARMGPVGTWIAQMAYRWRMSHVE
jgi:glycosyltransferase involved in cell wall biosynthesis